MDVDNPVNANEQLAPDDTETWLYAMRRMLPDIRSERTMTEHPDDARAKAALIFPPELRVLPDAGSTSPYLRKVLSTRLEQRSAIQDEHDVAQERSFHRREVHTLTRIRAQEDGLREPCYGEEDEYRLMHRKLSAVHAQAVYSKVQERFDLLKDQEARLKRARKILSCS